MSWKRRARNAKKSRVGSAFEVPDPALKNVTRVLAIDPGTRHCGMAWFELKEGGWTLVKSGEFSPIDCMLAARSWVVDVNNTEQEGNLVVEGYQLYPDKLQEQGMSRMGTPEVIGALKWMYLDECWLGFKSIERRVVRIQFFEPGASIKSHGRKKMVEMGESMRSFGPLGGVLQHAQDAESHGWYRIWKLLDAA